MYTLNNSHFIATLHHAGGSKKPRSHRPSQLHNPQPFIIEPQYSVGQLMDFKSLFLQTIYLTWIIIVHADGLSRVEIRFVQHVVDMMQLDTESSEHIRGPRTHDREVEDAVRLRQHIQENIKTKRCAICARLCRKIDISSIASADIPSLDQLIRDGPHQRDEGYPRAAWGHSWVIKP